VPAAFSASVFLAGGETSDDDSSSVAPRGAPLAHALELFAGKGFDGVVLSTQPRDGARPEAAERLLAWQEEALRLSDVLLLCLSGSRPSLPSHDAELWGQWQRSGRVVLLAPGSAESPLVRAAVKGGVPVGRTLAEAVQHCMGLLRGSALRRGGERAVPLPLWRSPSFQSWYRALRRAGHRLDDAQVEWTYRSRGNGRPPLLWAMRPRIYIPTERRHKAGEVVVGRTDVSATVLYHRGGARDFRDTLVVLVREFRSAVRNGSGFGLMLPGGSSAQASEREQDPRRTALKEVHEETGLLLDAAQLEAVQAGDRQLMASLSSHHAYLYRAELSDAQLAHLQADAAGSRSHGANPNERCYVTLRTVGSLLTDQDLDWSQLGMVLLALQPSKG
jgi:8-oxo-dGTP pyrophosphatase MutT (NUDIX family)